MLRLVETGAHQFVVLYLIVLYLPRGIALCRYALGDW